MPNKTIYVSKEDEHLFERAKKIAGEALSSVISLALREYVSRHEEKDKGMKEISVKVGSSSAQREQRFSGMEVGHWTGFSNDKVWYMSAKIYRTQKKNWAVLLMIICKASLLTDKQEWKESGDYLINTSKSELHVGKTIEDFKKKLPRSLFETLQQLAAKHEKPIEYLDI